MNPNPKGQASITVISISYGSAFWAGYEQRWPIGETSREKRMDCLWIDSVRRNGDCDWKRLHQDFQQSHG